MTTDLLATLGLTPFNETREHAVLANFRVEAQVLGPISRPILSPAKSHRSLCMKRSRPRALNNALSGEYKLNAVAIASWVSVYADRG